MWDTITKNYTYKSVFLQACLCHEFTSNRCPEKGNIQAFLNNLHMKKAELLAVGVNITTGTPLSNPYLTGWLLSPQINLSQKLTTK